MYDSPTRRVFAANGDSNSLSVIDADGLALIGSIPLDGGPEFAVTDARGRLYVNIEDKNIIDVVDTRTLKLTGHYDLAKSCDGPAGLAIDLKRSRLFAGCRNQKMAIVDAATGVLLAAPDIGKGSDAVRFDKGLGLAFSSNGDGTITVIGRDNKGQYVIQQIVKTKRGARTMELDPESHTIFLITADSDRNDPLAIEHPFPRPHFKDGTLQLLTVSPSKDRL